MSTEQKQNNQSYHNHKKILLLLDMHAILHRSYHALPDFTSPTGEPTGALYGLVAFLLKIIREMKPDYIAACYDLPGPTFRHEAYGEYKGKRAKTDDLLISQLKRSYDILKAMNIQHFSAPGFEADDMLGTIVEKMRDGEDVKIVVASGDLDTLQLVKGNDVVAYTPKKSINDAMIYNEEEVVKRFNFKPKLLPDYKGLKGDPSDNIIGVEGIGEKSATELIVKFGSLENLYKVLKDNKIELELAGVKPRIIKLLEEKEEEALFSKTLAEIRRDAPVDFDLAKCEWQKGLDFGKIETLFKELGFKTLLERVMQLKSVV